MNDGEVLNKHDYLNTAALNLPKVKCEMIVSNLNQKIIKMKQQKQKEAEKRYLEQRDREIMQNVLANLHKKDSLKVLLEEYEASLHKADNVNESPSGNRATDQLLSLQDLEDDSYSKKKEENLSLAKKKSIIAQNLKISKMVRHLQEKIRHQQAWATTYREEESEEPEFDLDGAKNEGLRALTQHEKIIMFGLFDRELQENLNTMKKMVGMKKQTYNPMAKIKENMSSVLSKTSHAKAKRTDSKEGENMRKFSQLVTSKKPV